MATSVTIDRLQLRGDSSHRELLLESLEQQDWPVTDDRRVYIVRRLEVTGGWWEIAYKAASHLRELMIGVVSGWDPSAFDAELVVFESEADYVACHCEFLMQGGSSYDDERLNTGSVSRPWFLRKVFATQMPQQFALGQLLLEDVLLVPDVLSILSRHQKLPALFTNLSVDSLAQLLSKVLAQYHVSISSRQLQADTGFSGNRGLIAGAATEGGPPGSLGYTAVETVQYALRAIDWQGAVQSLVPAKQRVVLRLLGVVATWRYQPQLLSHFTSLDELDSWCRAIFSGTNRDIEWVAQRAKIKPPDETHLPVGESVSTGVPSTLDSEPLVLSVDGSRETPSLAQYMTGCGGVLFLLNAFRLASLHDEIVRSDLSPWAWLVHLARAFQYPLDFGLEHFLADRLGLKEPHTLNLIDPLPDEDLWCQRLNQRFGNNAFWETPDWVRIPAQLEATETHIDVFLHFSSARVDLRLAGLDVSPGWLPWLGAVVNFHYGAYDVLAPQRNASKFQTEDNP